MALLVNLLPPNTPHGPPPHARTHTHYSERLTKAINQILPLLCTPQELNVEGCVGGGGGVLREKGCVPPLPRQLTSR